MSRRPNKYSWIVFTLVTVCITPSFSLADDTQGHRIDQTLNGYYDWTTNTAVATGIGIPPAMAVNEIQSREMTRSAAWSVALANLLEVVNGIGVTHDRTVHNHVTTNSEVRNHVEGMVKGATIVNEQDLPKGAIQVTVRMHFQQDVIPLGTSPTQVTKKPTPKPPTTRTNKTKKSHTGVLVDARNVKLTPVLRPRILTKDSEVYSEFMVSEEYISGPTIPREDQRRIAWYFTNEIDARKKAGANPFVIKVTRATGTTNSDLMIDEIEAQNLQITPGYKDLLREAKVAILVDPA